MSRKACIISTATVVILVLVVCVVLSQTVFKIRKPEAHMLSASIDSLQFNVSESPPTVSATVTSHFSIRNPNALAFRYKEGNAYAIYRDKILGQGILPAGISPAKKTLFVNLTLDTHTDHELMKNPDFAADFNSGVLPVTAYTKLDGWVKILNLFKPRFDLSINCTMNVFVFNNTIQTGDCVTRVRPHRH